MYIYIDLCSLPRRSVVSFRLASLRDPLFPDAALPGSRLTILNGGDHSHIHCRRQDCASRQARAPFARTVCSNGKCHPAKLLV